MNFLLVVGCLLVTGGMSELFSSEAGLQSIKDLGLQDFEEAHIRVERGTKSNKNRKVKIKRKNGNRKRKLKRTNLKRKFKKHTKVKNKIENPKNKNRAAANSRQSSCQTTSEVDAVCIQNAIDIL